MKARATRLLSKARNEMERLNMDRDLAELAVSKVQEQGGGDEHGKHYQ